ncbi:MAG: PilZ domain-containing protein [Candidatus Omnitrophica bacterium]|nr:PilZ domain-containing protein [Candidatus Omnitrophota bacterium]
MEELEKLLVQDRWVEAWQIDVARLEANSSRKSLWSCLVKLGFLSEEDIAAFFAHASGIPYVRVSDYVIAPKVLHLLDENFCIQNVVIPLFKTGDTLFVACANPFNTALTDGLAKMTGTVIEPLVAAPHAILGAVDLYFRLDDRNFEMADFIVKKSSVTGVSQWRESERLSFSAAVKIIVLDETVTLMSRYPIEGKAVDLSADGSAVGIELPFYLPKGITISMTLYSGGLASSGSVIEGRGEILRSAMLKSKSFLAGVKFLDMADKDRKQLLSFSSSQEN